MSHHKPRMKFNHVLICDDVRREDNGKYLLIGVYGENIVFPKIPAQTMLSFLLEADQVDTGKIPFQIRGSMTSDDKEMFVISGEANVKEPVTSATMVVGPIPLIFENEGELCIEVKQYEDKWQSLKSISVLRSSSLSTSEQPPPS